MTLERQFYENWRRPWPVLNRQYVLPPPPRSTAPQSLSAPVTASFCRSWDVSPCRCSCRSRSFSRLNGSRAIRSLRPSRISSIRCAPPGRPPGSSTRRRAASSPWPSSRASTRTASRSVPRDRQRNRAVTDTYEPGSTFKVVTVTGALETGMVTPSTSYTLPYDDRGRRPDDPRRRAARDRDDDRLADPLPLVERRRRSRSRSGWGADARRLDRPVRLRPARPASSTRARRAGSSSRRSSGRARRSETSRSGTGIAVTPLQMASAYAAIANGGVWIQPHLVERVGGDGVGPAGAAAR